MNAPPLVSVVVPVYNEEANLDELVRRSIAACDGTSGSFELILVDDGSADASAQKIAEAVDAHHGRVIGVLLNRNYGQHAAVMAGFEQSRGDIVITLDADLQNPPEEIPRLIHAVQQGADVVATIRVPRQDTLFRRVASYITNKAVQHATGIMMHDYGCMLRAYRRNVIDAMLKCTEHSTFIPVLANYFAHRTAELEVRHSSRAGGDSKYNLRKLINLQFDLLTSMTTFPLRLLSVLGGLAAAGGVGMGVFLLVMRLIYGPHWAAEGVFTLFAVLFTLIGAQFIGIGLLGEYIGRIYHDVRARPRYCIREVVGRDSSEIRARSAKVSEVLA